MEKWHWSGSDLQEELQQQEELTSAPLSKDLGRHNPSLLPQFGQDFWRCQPGTFSSSCSGSQQEVGRDLFPLNL